jgi:sugar phosphate isomerase/epimerase
LLDEAAISCYELVPLSLTSSTEANAQSLATVEQLAVDVDARHVLATVRGPVNNVVVDGLRRAAGALAEIDVAIAVEFMPTTALATLNDARRLVERCATDAPAGIVIDVWHFVLGQSSWSSLADLPLELIGFVQLDDAPADAEGISLTDCMERRELPGEGALPLARFRGALAQRGFAGVVSVEVLSEAWRARPIGEFAAATLRASQRVWLR